MNVVEFSLRHTMELPANVSIKFRADTSTVVEFLLDDLEAGTVRFIKRCLQNTIREAVEQTAQEEAQKAMAEIAEFWQDYATVRQQAAFTPFRAKLEAALMLVTAARDTEPQPHGGVPNPVYAADAAYHGCVLDW